MALGALLVLGSIEPELRNNLFWAGMFVIGAGFGLLASQLGNVNMSAVKKDDTAEVGGLQGTYQNMGTSLGTALVGSVFMLTLTSGFTDAINDNPNLSDSVKSQVTAQSEKGVQIVSTAQAKEFVLSKGGSQQAADEISHTYQDSQVKALKEAMFFVFVAAVAAYALSRNLPE